MLSRLRLLTAGESHGPGLSVVVDGLPYGLALDGEAIARDLRRRQGGYGRGDRMRIESDRAEIRGGVRHGRTLGGPVALWIENRDFASWREAMSPEPVQAGVDPRPLTRPRPGHGDLAGARKLGIDDARPVLERASARETAARVAAGALARALLEPLGVLVGSHTLGIGSVRLPDEPPVAWADIAAIPPDSPFRVADPSLEPRLRAEVDRAREDGDSLGGSFEVVAHTPPVGLGHYVQWDLRLDGRIGQAMLSIPSAKMVAIGLGERAGERRGSEVHDPIRGGPGGRIVRPSNRAGGIEAGMTNGEEVRVRVAVKPISTLARPLESIDLRTGERADAAWERSDVTVVPAAGVVGEAMLALVLADAVLEKFGGDSLEELRERVGAWREATRS